VDVGEGRRNIAPFRARRILAPNLRVEQIEQHLVDALVRHERLDQRAAEIDRLLAAARGCSRRSRRRSFVLHFQAG
jgi:hypothetical protein